MNATFTLDGICFIIEPKGSDISLTFPGGLPDDEVHLSQTNAKILALSILSAVEELQE